MSYSHADPSPVRTGEWDSPRRSSSARTPAASTAAGTPRESAGQLVRARDTQPALSKLKQEVLPEDEYLAHLSHIIQRDFFPHLTTLEHRNDVLDAFASKDPARIDSSVRRLRDLGATPTPRKRARASATPYSSRDTPADPSLTPTYFDRTPLTSFTDTPASSTSRVHRRRAPSPPPAPGAESLSLDAFQARFTSEDNSSFQDLVDADNAARRDKHAWAFSAEQRANARAVRGRQARERLVDVTKRMVESSKDGTVRLLEGPAGRPGEQRLVVDEGVEVGPGETRLIVGRDANERRLITDGRGADRVGDVKGKGKEKEVPERVDERAKQYVDWDKPTADEEQDNGPVEASELQLETTAWPFKTRNSLMFPPDADRSAPSSLTGPPPHNAPSSSSSRAKDAPPVLLGEPKGVRYHATRLDSLERGTGGTGSSVGGSQASLSPSRSRIGAAIAGTPYPAPPASQTPRVSGFSFVDALPSVPSSSLPPQALQELMTWGTIEATPVTLRSSDADASVGPFRVRESDRREELAHRMARRAKRSLADGGTAGIAASSSGGAGGSTGLRRSALEASVRSTASRGAGGATPGAGGSTPRRAAASDALSPAARSLLGRTQPGRALERGLGRSSEWGEDEERRRVERARQRAREVESRDRLRRERWTPSPAVSMGFDPDLDN